MLSGFIIVGIEQKKAFFKTQKEGMAVKA